MMLISIRPFWTSTAYFVPMARHTRTQHTLFQIEWIEFPFKSFIFWGEIYFYIEMYKNRCLINEFSTPSSSSSEWNGISLLKHEFDMRLNFTSTLNWVWFKSRSVRVRALSGLNLTLNCEKLIANCVYPELQIGWDVVLGHLEDRHLIIARLRIPGRPTISDREILNSLMKSGWLA